MPLWPQLREALERYLAEHPPSKLLFPSFRTGQEAMLTDFRKVLDAVAMRAGWEEGDIRPKMFRHTYCATRLQTLDAGAPVSTYTVAREMGHGGEAMVRRFTDTLDKSGIAPRRWSTVSNNTLLS